MLARHSAVLVLLAAPVVAGDPCPIDFRFHDLGTPEWVDGAAVLTGLVSKDSWVGLSFTDGKGGVRIQAVSPDGPAARAGIAKGDIVVGAAGKAVAKHGELAAAFRAAAPGATVELDVQRGETRSKVKVTLGQQDPLLGALIDHASAQSCAAVRRVTLDGSRTKTLRALLFTKQRRFRCDEAHTVLAKALQPGDIVFVRGSRRVLISNPGSATTCLRAASADGPTLTPKRVAALFDELTRDYIADRHANP